MFLGRGREARAAYLQHKGKHLFNNDDKIWEQVVAEDFAEFKKRGLSHPQMAEIRKLITTPPQQHR